MLRWAHLAALTLAAFVLGQAVAADEKKGETLKTVIDVTHEFDKDKKKLTVTAVGQVPTGGWSGAKLTPRPTKEAPKDGIYEFDLTAVRPDGIVTQVISKVKATHIWENPPADIKGIKVYGADKGTKTIKFDK
ncbi:hypothetical protein GobsT_01080 [Gemmata obscuriglobus]|uniref:TIGR03000 domain-containing protein n=1 Tax=Gemmata obscuriglobus TaxID=114 RepID=A0A2Z3HIH6_9BACT|nr:hypothetical protein [Gemmata obscuriglobus]AWM41270.1 hypothetical protein C1280_32610 [Gemmata obscuriglobus]QEG25383.1 hypothetical protein GobsT_01080 [Gemmata obscuriglobus]VTR98411.1 Uncharacterized protein OS=Nitrosospira sp. APG3 GN=EBAPG3_11740 PE=4 SV=1 [Gemmata obscuriglobus UQM 2246]